MTNLARTVEKKLNLIAFVTGTNNTEDIISVYI